MTIEKSDYIPRGKINLKKFVNSFEEAIYWGKKNYPKRRPWSIDEEELIPNEINVFEKERNISVMGFGENYNEAYFNCLKKLEKRLDKRRWDFIRLRNGIPLRNGANFQIHLGATLYKLER